MYKYRNPRRIIDKLFAIGLICMAIACLVAILIGGGALALGSVAVATNVFGVAACIFGLGMSFGLMGIIFTVVSDLL